MGKIGIVGQGYVGTAIKVGFEPHYNIHTYDKFDLAKSTLPNLKDLVQECEVIFVCVPTPMRKDGTCYTGIVEEVIREIDSYATDNPIVVINQQFHQVLLISLIKVIQMLL
jgi:UDPglucose 6-dehydrogenase